MRDKNDIHRLIQNETSAILVSACLLGVNCKYDGKNNLETKVIEALKGKEIVPICPEQLGGLPTPRIPQSIQEGSGEDVLALHTKVITRNGLDVTKEFIKGAQEALRIAKLTGTNIAILKEHSPSCGVHKIYNKKNTASEGLVKGSGVTTAILQQNRILVFSEEDLSK